MSDFEFGWQVGVLEHIKGYECRFQGANNNYEKGYYGGWCWSMNQSLLRKDKVEEIPQIKDVK